jgi:hypothetical protein
MVESYLIKRRKQAGTMKNNFEMVGEISPSNNVEAYRRKYAISRGSVMLLPKLSSP